MSFNDWKPKSLLALRDYNLHTFMADLGAGVTVGLVALPLAMAFAIASGAPPQAGLYTAVVAGGLIAALGGSRTQIGGPTGAFVVIIFGILARYGFNGLLLCTMMAGLILIALGASGLGGAIKFIPRPVIIGFTNGIAILIASTQIKDFFGLTTAKIPGDFLGRMQVLAHGARSVSVETTLLACFGLGTILLVRRYLPRIPGYIVALVSSTALVYFLHLHVETLGTRFGGIPSGFPHLHVPVFDFSLMRTLIAPAITVAMLGAIESLMSAVVADRMSGDRHNPNVELIAQGIANIASPLFGGLPATGAIARTATNIRSGGTTPVAGIVHAATVLIVLLVAAPLAQFIPLAVLAAILIVVCYNMGEWSEVPAILKLSRLEVSVWSLTFLLTVFVNLTVAVEAGMILAALVYIRKVTTTTTISLVTDAYIEDGRPHILQDLAIPPYVAIFRIHGPFLFGATEKLVEISDALATLPPIIILRLRNMTAIDATGLQAMERLAEEVRTAKRTLVLCGAREQPAKRIQQSNLTQQLGPDNICPNIVAALQRAQQLAASS